MHCFTTFWIINVWQLACRGIVLLKYELARHLRYGRQQLSWQKQVTVIDSIEFVSQIEGYRSAVAQFRHPICHRQWLAEPSLLCKQAFCAKVCILCCRRCVQSQSICEFFNAANMNNFLSLNQIQLTSFSNKWLFASVSSSVSWCLFKQSKPNDPYHSRLCYLVC